MRSSRLFLPTLREDPADAEIVSHKLLVRAGFIRKLSTGIYSYLPLGLKVLNKLENIIRQEMDRAGAQEILMPVVQPGELWQESGRWDKYGNLLLKFKDRHDHEFCLAPTHEEVVTDLIRKDVRSYRDLPLNLYQIQTKFRDEIRPRFGLMRLREFHMKDAYSFDVDDEGANKSYQAMFEAYKKIFTRCGLDFKAVEADSGEIGGSYSHEFMVLADTGEDAVVNCLSCDYAANTEKAEIAEQEMGEGENDTPAMEKVSTPNRRTVEEVTRLLKIAPKNLIKTIIYTFGEADDNIVAVLVRGDHTVNEIKLKNVLGGETPELAGKELVTEATGAPVGFAGPVGLKIRIIADNSLKARSSAVVGANEGDHHFQNAVLGRDFEVSGFHDLRFAEEGDLCPRCNSEMTLQRGIEVGHVFKLGTNYSESMKAVYRDKEGKENFIIMGCYGIGPDRAVAASIEQNHDKNGIIWPMALAPFEVIVMPLQAQNEEVTAASEKLYDKLKDLGIDALFDDRDERAGIKFKDADLVGIPLKISVSKKTLALGKVEFKARTGGEVQFLDIDSAALEILKMRDQLLAG